MPVTKQYDSKKKCYHLSRNEKTIKKYAGKVLDIIGKVVPGTSYLKGIAKQILKAKLKAKNYCQSDIDWLMRNI